MVRNISAGNKRPGGTPNNLKVDCLELILVYVVVVFITDVIAIRDIVPVDSPSGTLV